jgi:hypothetical protein
MTTSSFRQPDPDRSETPPRAVTLDDLFRIAYFEGCKLTVEVLGGHSTRHCVTAGADRYQLDWPEDRRLLIKRASR